VTGTHEGAKMNERFLSRWSRRKHDSRRADDERDCLAPASPARDAGAPAPTARNAGAPAPTARNAGAPAPTARDAGGPASAVQHELQQPSPPARVDAEGRALASNDDPARGDAPPASTQVALPAIESLTPESDFRAFMQPGVDSATRNAALAQLFRDPHYSVMDGLDVYIDDYTQPDPIAPQMLAKLKQLHAVGLPDEATEPGSSLPALAARSETDDAGEAALAAPSTENDASAPSAAAGETHAPEPADDSTGVRTKPQEPQP